MHGPLIPMVTETEAYRLRSIRVKGEKKGKISCDSVNSGFLEGNTHTKTGSLRFLRRLLADVTKNACCICGNGKIIIPLIV